MGNSVRISPFLRAPQVPCQPTSSASLQTGSHSCRLQVFLIDLDEVGGVDQIALAVVPDDTEQGLGLSRHQALGVVGG